MDPARPGIFLTASWDMAFKPIYLLLEKSQEGETGRLE
jgi:hypothetical protein